MEHIQRTIDGDNAKYGAYSIAVITNIEQLNVYTNRTE